MLLMLVLPAAAHVALGGLLKRAKPTRHTAALCCVDATVTAGIEADDAFAP